MYGIENKTKLSRMNEIDDKKICNQCKLYVYTQICSVIGTL